MGLEGNSIQTPRRAAPLHGADRFDRLGSWAPFMTQDKAQISVRIMEKEYVVACAYEERSALLDAAEFLNARMREIRDSGKLVGHDRIAVMVALNLANELLRLRNRDAKLEGEVGTRLRAMRERVEGVLEKGQQLEL
jgi:cell division protein ZapA